MIPCTCGLGAPQGRGQDVRIHWRQKVSESTKKHLTGFLALAATQAEVAEEITRGAHISTLSPR
jgi:hypothetical protein